MQTNKTAMAEVVVKAESQEPESLSDLAIPDAPPDEAPPIQETNPYQAVLDQRLAENEDLKRLAEEAEKHREDKQKCQFRIMKLKEELEEGSVDKECHEFFDAMLASVQAEPETRDSLHIRLMLIEQSTFKSKLIRLLVYQSAVDYNNGTSTYFSELKEEMAGGNTKKEIERNQATIGSLDQLLEVNEKSVSDITSQIYAEVKAEEEARAEEEERQRIADEEEAREVEAMKELERMRLEQEALRKEEEERQRALEEENDRLNNTGYAASQPYVVGDSPLEGVEGTYPIKTERIDHTAELLEEFQRHDRAGRRRIRSERAAKRADRAARRDRGENVSDEEWIEELDGKFADDSDEDSTTSTTQTSVNTSTENAPAHNHRTHYTDMPFSWSSIPPAPTTNRPTIPAKRPSISPDQAPGSNRKKSLSFAEYKDQRPAGSAHQANRTSSYHTPHNQPSNGDPRRSAASSSSVHSNGDPRRAATDPRRVASDPRLKATDPRKRS